MFEFSFAALLFSAGYAFVRAGKAPHHEPLGPRFLYLALQSLSACGLGWGAVNGWLSLEDPSGWYPMFALFVVIPAVLLLGVGVLVGWRAGILPEGWWAATAIHGASFVALLAVARTGVWNWW